MYSEADKVKDEGNIAFKSGNYMEAIMKYTDAIALCPLSARKKQAIYYRYEFFIVPDNSLVLSVLWAWKVAMCNLKMEAPFCFYSKMVQIIEYARLCLFSKHL